MNQITIKHQEKEICCNWDTVVITGDGKPLLHDLKNIEQALQHHYVFYCIGRSIQAVPGHVAHYADVDADAGLWVAEHLAEKHGHKAAGECILRHTLGKCRGFDVDWDVTGSPWDMDEVLWQGSTALFAVLTAIEMGYERIILAGCPLDSCGHWYFPEQYRGPKWTGETYQVWLDFANDPRADKVRSMSGYTRQIIGHPTPAWLKGYPNAK